MEEDKRKKSHSYKVKCTLSYMCFPVGTLLIVRVSGRMYKIYRNVALGNTELLITIECIMRLLHQLRSVAFGDAFTEFFISSKVQIETRNSKDRKSMNVN